MIRDAITHLFSSGGGGGGGVGGGEETLVVGQYWTVFLSRLGASSTEIGLIRSINSVVNALLAAPMGFFTDRTQRKKRLYIIGKLLFLPIGLLRYLATSWPFCVFIGAFETASMRLMGPSSQIILIDSLSAKDRVRGLSINRTVMSIAGLIGPLICAAIINAAGGLEAADNFRPLFLLSFVVGLVTTILVVTQMREVAFPVVGQQTNFVSHMISVFQEVPLLKLMLLRQCAMMFIMELGMTFQTIYMVDIKGADEFILAWRGTAQTALTVLVSLPLSALIERYGRLRISYLGRVFGCLGLLLMIATPLTHPELLIVAALCEGLRMLMFIGWMAFEQELVPLTARGRYGGINMTVAAVAGIFAPILGGFIWEINPDYLWWIRIGGEAFVVLPLMLLVGSRAKRMNPDSMQALM